MPYGSNAELPPALQRRLPVHAQDIYRKTFNHVFATRPWDPRREEAARRIAWAAVKRWYMKHGDTWVGRAGIGP